jgi:Alginate export
MKSWRAGTALMVAAVMAAGSFAQTSEQLRKQFEELKASVQRLEAENAGLKETTPQNAGLETEINRLSERMAAGTNLRSCASAIKLGGEFRYRAGFADLDQETQVIVIPGGPGTDGLTTTDDGSGSWGDMRTRLNFQYDFGCDVTAFAELQAHSAFGQDSDGPIDEWDGNDSVGNVGMYQSWLEFRNMTGRPEMSMRIGRQEVVLGNQFQFGDADWYNGVVHDGVRVDWKGCNFSLTLLAMKLTSEDGDFNQIWSLSDHDDDELLSAYVTLKSIRCMQLDAYWIYINGHGVFALNSGANSGPGFLYPTQSAYYHTFGARLGGTFDIGCGLDYNIEGAIQTGTAGPADVDGFAVEAELGMTFSKNAKFRVFARGLFAEGPDSDGVGYLINYPNRHSNGAFRARYGIADVIPMSNVATIQLGFHFDPGCNWTVGATGLYALADQDFGLSSDEYGTELDIWAEYRHSANVKFGAGVALVQPDDFGAFVWGTTDDTQIVGYLQARLVF